MFFYVSEGTAGVHLIRWWFPANAMDRTDPETRLQGLVAASKFGFKACTAGLLAAACRAKQECVWNGQYLYSVVAQFFSPSMPVLPVDKPHT